MLKIKAERLKRVDLNLCVSFDVGYKIKWQISEYLLFFIFQCPVWHESSIPTAEMPEISSSRNLDRLDIYFDPFVLK